MRIMHSALLLGLLNLTALPCSAAEPIGRLFMTPEQRHVLDVLRETAGDGPVDPGSLLPPSGPAADRQVVLNGLVRRSLGPDVVWVNGVRTGASDAPIRLRQGPDGSDRVTLEDAANGNSVRLKPGQYWQPSTGHVADCYGCAAPAATPDVTPSPTEITAGEP